MIVELLVALLAVLVAQVKVAVAQQAVGRHQIEGLVPGDAGALACPQAGRSLKEEAEGDPEGQRGEKEPVPHQQVNH